MVLGATARHKGEPDLHDGLVHVGRTVSEKKDTQVVCFIIIIIIESISRRINSSSFLNRTTTMLENYVNLVNGRPAGRQVVNEK